jgi:hypothetical protein
MVNKGSNATKVQDFNTDSRISHICLTVDFFLLLLLLRATSKFMAFVLTFYENTEGVYVRFIFSLHAIVCWYLNYV